MLHSRGGATYELRFATAFSDDEALALVAATVVAAGLVAGMRWAAALLGCFAVLVLGLGVVHPCRIAFQDTPQFDGCSASAVATALGLYLPLAAVSCAVARRLGPDVAPAAVAALLGGSAAVVLVSLFGPWYGASDDGHDFNQTGWQAFQRFDVYLAVVAIAAGALAGAVVLGRRRACDQLGAAVALLALSAAGIAFYRLFTAADPPSSGFVPHVAAYVALSALLAMACAALAARPRGRARDPADWRAR